MDVALLRILSTTIRTMFVASMAIMAVWVSPVLTVMAQEGNPPNASELSNKIKTLTIRRDNQQPTLIMTTDESILDLSREMLKTSPTEIIPYRESDIRVRVLTDEPVISTPVKTNPEHTQTNTVAHDTNHDADMLEDPLRYWTQSRTWLIILLLVAIVITVVLYRRAKTRKQIPNN